MAFLHGALALTYDLLFGSTGLLSFGHAIYFHRDVSPGGLSDAYYHGRMKYLQFKSKKI
ncbi:MAG: hypothetical protein AABY37_04305 [Actinomycetota bacterium]